MAKQIETMSELVSGVQNDLEAVRSGSIDIGKGRLLKDYYKLLLKAAELTLQYQRMERGKRPEKELRLIALPDKTEAA